MKCIYTLTIILLLFVVAGCGAHYKYSCTSAAGDTTEIDISSLRDVEDGVTVTIRDCGQNVTIETSGLDNGHAEVQAVAAAIVPLAKAAAHTGGLP